MSRTGEVPSDKVPPGSLAHALVVASRVHGDQVDKLGAPYLLHVCRVVERVTRLAPPDLAHLGRIAAALHDTVEDADVPWTFDDMADAGFAPDVVSAVDAVTKRVGEGYDEMIRRAAQDPVGRWVKLADNLDNSDPERARELDPATSERLAAKYAGARQILAKHGASVPDEPGAS